MSISFKHTLAAALLAAGLVSPALAQSFDPDVGTGNIVPGTTTPLAPAPAVHIGKTAIHRSGLRAFAMVPDQPAKTSNDPENAGGGSAGYNDMLLRY